MPKVAIDYSRALIYKIICNDPNVKDVYVGSTTNFKERERCHKKNCNIENSNGYNLKVYRFMRENGGFDNWRMELVEMFPTDNKLKLYKREGEVIRSLGATLNSKIAGRSVKDYNADNIVKRIEFNKTFWANNKEKGKEEKKNYYQNNKELIKEYGKEYYQNNKEKCKEIKKKYYQTNLEQIQEYKKKYYQNNLENIKEQQRKYYENNRENYIDKKKEKVKCDCGCEIRKDGLIEHRASKKHANLMKPLGEPI